MLAPKKVKWRKQQRGRMRGVASRCNSLTFGEFGLQAMQPGWIDSKQLEAARIAMTRHVKRGGHLLTAGNLAVQPNAAVLTLDGDLVMLQLAAVAEAVGDLLGSLLVPRHHAGWNGRYRDRNH